MVKIVLIAIVFFLYYYWVFSSTGVILAEFLKIRTKNIYFGIIIDFFFYFAVISFLLIPLEFIPNLRYIILVYSLLSINILYSLFLLYRNYSRVHDIEIMMYLGRKKILFVVPIIFTIISVVIVLTIGKNNLNFWTLETIVSPLYVQLELGRWEPWKNIVFLIIYFVFLGLALIWLFLFELISNFGVKTPINMLSILTITFFNPLVGRFLILIFNEQALLNNTTVFIVALLVALNIGVYALKIKPFKKWHFKKPTIPPHHKKNLKIIK